MPILVLRVKSKVATICAWCADKDELGATLKRAGWDLSHGMCEKCLVCKLLALDKPTEASEVKRANKP